MGLKPPLASMKFVLTAAVRVITKSLCSAERKHRMQKHNDGKIVCPCGGSGGGRMWLNQKELLCCLKIKIWYKPVGFTYLPGGFQLDII